MSVEVSNGLFPRSGDSASSSSLSSIELSNGLTLILVFLSIISVEDTSVEVSKGLLDLPCFRVAGGVSSLK